MSNIDELIIYKDTKKVVNKTSPLPPHPRFLGVA